MLNLAGQTVVRKQVETGIGISSKRIAGVKDVRQKQDIELVMLSKTKEQLEVLIRAAKEIEAILPEIKRQDRLNPIEVIEFYATSAMVVKK